MKRGHRNNQKHHGIDAEHNSQRSPLSLAKGVNSATVITATTHFLNLIGNPTTKLSRGGRGAKRRHRRRLERVVEPSRYAVETNHQLILNVNSAKRGGRAPERVARRLITAANARFRGIVSTSKNFTYGFYEKPETFSIYLVYKHFPFMA
jgi:hypothetical protein